MRISHKHKFIFLATPRTASTTVRKVLDKYSDIKSVHKTLITKDNPFYHHISAKELKIIFNQRNWDWDAYEKFCFVRNPYDRVVSLFHHHIKSRRDLKINSIKEFFLRIKYSATPEPTFKNFVKNLDPEKRLPTSIQAFACDDSGNFLINNILKYENLGSDLANFLKKVDINIHQDEIPHLNMSINRDKFITYYDDSLKEIVLKKYKFEFDNFKYF